MIGYVMYGTNDLEQASAFYDALFSVTGAGRVYEDEKAIAWGVNRKSPALSVTKPIDGNAANVGNGSMVALAAASAEQVDQLYAKAMELGGADEGAPGDRGNGFYAAYFRDLDGNKFAAFHIAGS